MEIKTYQDVLEHLKKSKRQKHLLLGNGFSMSYDKKIFSYNALSDFVKNSEDELLQKLFGIINTCNFELIMSQLDVFYELAKDFVKDKGLAKSIKTARDSIKRSLVDAISALHPEQVFKIPKTKSESCALFLKEYFEGEGHIFSANYDLLLYWVLMRNQDVLGEVCDGFGKQYLEGTESEDGEPVFGDLEWGPNLAEQRVHYLHGALHIFDTGVSIEKEIYNGDYLLENIKKRIEDKEYPVFVTAGDGDQKLKHILHNQYLDYCYKQLSSISGSLITFGFHFGDYDQHIIDAINKAAKRSIKEKLWSIYIGVYSKEDIKHVESIASKFKCKVNVFDSRTANVWGV